MTPSKKRRSEMQLPYDSMIGPQPLPNVSCFEYVLFQPNSRNWRVSLAHGICPPVCCSDGLQPKNCFFFSQGSSLLPTQPTDTLPFTQYLEVPITPPSSRDLSFTFSNLHASRFLIPILAPPPRSSTTRRAIYPLHQTIHVSMFVLVIEIF